jgi:hypothetical protein
LTPGVSRDEVDDSSGESVVTDDLDVTPGGSVWYLRDRGVPAVGMRRCSSTFHRSANVLAL